MFGLRFRNINLSFILFFLLYYSCIMDEFKMKDAEVKESWEIGITTPMFAGNLEFRDFIHDWKLNIPPGPAPFVILDYNDRGDRKIPVELIFDPSAVVDSLPFYIQGSYEFTAVDIIFSVKNNSPFPLNLQLFFYEKESFGSWGSPVQPPAFDAVFPVIQPGVQLPEIHRVSLPESEIENFTLSNRVRIVSWFTSNSYIINNDTLSAHYPINLSILLEGKVRAKLHD